MSKTNINHFTTAFISSLLKIEAQYAPINDAQVFDINKDGNLDIVTVGNLYGSEVETTRADAGIGNVLIGDGMGNFRNIDHFESGFYAPEDARKILLLKNEKIQFMVLNNNSQSNTFELIGG